MGEPLFLLGAGFNWDSRSYIKEYDINNRLIEYPLVTDLGKHCFTEEVNGSDVEQAFTKAYLEKRSEPLKHLVDIIERADYYIAGKLITYDSSIYHKFVEKYPRSSFLTYNYDALLEVLLFHLGMWSPKNGFGFNTDFQIYDTPLSAPFRDNENASTVILHLHGSIYFYPKYGFDNDDLVNLKTKDDIEIHYTFDPHSIGRLFPGLRSKIPDLTFSWADDRFIPPIKDKKLLLEDLYYWSIKQRASELIDQCSEIIAIGFSFANNDESTFDSVLRQLITSGKLLFIVSPNAEKIADRLKLIFPNIRIGFFTGTFSEWMEPRIVSST